MISLPAEAGSFAGQPRGVPLAYDPRVDIPALVEGPPVHDLCGDVRIKRAGAAVRAFADRLGPDRAAAWPSL